MRIARWNCSLACILTSMTLISMPAAAQMPDSPTGRMAQALAELIGGPDAEAVASFVKKRVVPSSADDEEMSEALEQLRTRCAGARMAGAEKTGPTTASLSFDMQGGGCRVSYEIEPAAPHRLISLAVEASGPRAGAPSSGADGELRELVDSFVEAFNSGQADKMMAFYEESATESFRSRRTDEEDRALYDRLYGDMGSISLQDLDVDSDTLRASFSSPRVPDRIRFVFSLEAYRIDGFSVAIGGPEMDSADFPPLDLDPEADDETLGRILDGYFEGLARDGLFSGSVLVARAGQPIFEGAYGLANREAARKNTPQTRFDIGSITKLMTKVAIGQLVRDGKLKLDDTLYEQLPDYPDTDNAKQITVQQLLEHSSGLGDIFNEKWDSVPKEKLLAPRDFFPIFTGRPLLFEPGEGRSYSNAGYIVLGAIIEVASGTPYDVYLKKHIFDPAGMRASGFPIRDGSNADLAVGYTRRGSGGSSAEARPNLGMLPIKGCPAGSSSHTAEDLWKFDRALRSGKLLGPGWTAWAFTGVVPDASKMKKKSGTRLAGHPIGVAGGGPGVSALLESDADTAVIVLANIDEPGAEGLGLMLHRKIAGL